MKKNISINISGIIFHIEEDGYENLRKYLDSINRYFSSFEDSSEILADIESRIAEIFLSKLNEGKQVITAEDVNSLIATMGSVSDFKAAEEQDAPDGGSATNDNKRTEEETASAGSTSEQQRQTGYTEPRKLYRDQKRKILGGVCSGMANYFNIDPVWIRLFFALFTAAYGVGFLVYVVFWIAVPGSFELDEPEVERKLFRDASRKVLAGVSGGLAAYFGIDIVVVRVLFVVFTFTGGVGLLVYLVLWIVLPEARSLTDRMQMQGEPVTLSNIETNIKKNLNVKEDEEESVWMKLLLLPFRIISMLITALGKILVPVAELLRVVIGLFVFFIGLGLIIGVIMSTGILFGIFSGIGLPILWATDVSELSIPLHAFSNAFPAWTVVAAFFGAIIPCIFLLLLGISIIARRVVFNATVGWSMFVVFFLSVAALSVGIPRIVYNFKEHGEHKVEKAFQITGKTAVLRINETGLDDYEGVDLYLRANDDPGFLLVQTFEAQGPTRLKAAENAQMVDYNVTLQDSVFYFDSNLRFKDDAIFRGQQLRMTLYIPYNTPFIIGDGMYRLINQYIGDWSVREGNTWMMTQQGLKCLTCPVEEMDTDQSTYYDSSDSTQDQYGLSGFDELNVSGFIDLRVYQGDEYSVELIGPEREKERYSISQRGETLYIKYEDERRFSIRGFGDFNEMRINITLPHVSRMELRGVGDVLIRDFDEAEADIRVLGVLKVRAQDFNCTELNLRLNGASEMDLSGHGNSLDATIQGASKLNAYDYEVTDAIVDANGASKARVYVTGTLEIEESVVSDVDYRGNPRVIRRD